MDALRNFLVEKALSKVAIKAITQELKELNRDEEIQKMKMDEKVKYLAQRVAGEVFVQSNIYGAVSELCREFGIVSILEKYGNYVKIRVSIEEKEKSIGYLFKLVQAIHQSHEMSEYSVSQTTLEQIFQSFANLKFDESVKHFKYSETLCDIEDFTPEVLKKKPIEDITQKAL